MDRGLNAAAEIRNRQDMARNAMPDLVPAELILESLDEEREEVREEERGAEEGRQYIIRDENPAHLLNLDIQEERNLERYDEYGEIGNPIRDGIVDADGYGETAHMMELEKRIKLRFRWNPDQVVCALKIINNFPRIVDLTFVQYSLLKTFNHDFIVLKPYADYRCSLETLEIASSTEESIVMATMEFKEACLSCNDFEKLLYILNRHSSVENRQEIEAYLNIAKGEERDHCNIRTTRLRPLETRMNAMMTSKIIDIFEEFIIHDTQFVKRRLRTSSLVYAFGSVLWGFGLLHFSRKIDSSFVLKSITENPHSYFKGLISLNFLCFLTGRLGRSILRNRIIFAGLYENIE